MRRAMLWIGVLVACGKTDTGSSAGSASPPATQTGAAASAPAAGTTGSASISGTIKFVGTPPANPAIDMSEEAECKKKYTTPPTDPQVVVANGSLANVFVYVKSGLPPGAKYPVPTTSAVIDQQGCLYHPRAFGVMTGQKIQIKNSDPVLHNIKAVPTKNRGFNISQPSAGMTTERSFTTEEVMVPLQCNVHGWMHASVGVVSHPFFATTGADGTFKISGLPAGTYEIAAVHDKLGTQITKVTVGGNEAKTADFSFTAKST